MADKKTYDLVVIGGGPAGYAAAIRAGQLGKSVACVEVERAGGTCLNWGCIPSKALLKSAELYQSMLHAADFGLAAGEVSADFSAVIQRSRAVADKMAGGIEFLFKKNKVDYLRGKGSVPAPGTVAITAEDGQVAEVAARNILVATGCRARKLPDVPVDGERIMTSREALVMKERPESVVIVGAGAIGAEFAYFLNSMGSEVTLVEMLPQVLPVEDAEVAAALERSFKRQGIQGQTGTSVESIKVGKKSVKLELVKNGKRQPMEVSTVLLAIGVVPNLEGVFPEGSAPKLDRGYLVVDERYQTSLPGVFAAGDIIGPPWLAHVATWEALQAVNGIFGVSQPKKVKIFPGCTYCQPQVASVGKTEQKLKEEGTAYKVGKFPFAASGKAVASNHPEGFVKLLVSEPYGELLGAHIIGDNATELLPEYVLSMESEITAEEIHHAIHAHPTLSEALMEAAAAAFGEAIHI